MGYSPWDCRVGHDRVTKHRAAGVSPHGRGRAGVHVVQGITHVWEAFRLDEGVWLQCESSDDCGHDRDRNPAMKHRSNY